MFPRLRRFAPVLGSAVGLAGKSLGPKFDRGDDEYRFRKSLFPNIGVLPDWYTRSIDRGCAQRPWTGAVRCMDEHPAAEDPATAPRPPELTDRDDAEREVKRRRFDWAQWELSPMRRLREEGDGLDIVPEHVADVGYLRDEIVSYVGDIQAAHPQWAIYGRQVQGAVILLHFANEASRTDWESNLFKTKIAIGLLKDDLRAHESGGYSLVCGVWQPTGEKFTSSIIGRLEDVTKMAMAIVAIRFDVLDGAGEAERRDLLRQIAEQPHVQAQQKRWIREAEKKIKDSEGKGWAADTLFQLSRVCPSWSKGEGVFANYCKWGFTPRPQNNGLVAFKDCVLHFGDTGVQQKSRAEVEDVYTYIPESIAYRPSEEFIDWFRQYFTTTVAGDMDVMHLEFAIESLAMRGLRIPHHCVIYFGKGGNSKGARSRLRAKAHATGHKWVSPSVFDKAVKDEFRMQGHEFYGAVLCTIREADAFEFDEKVFRAWTAGEGNACRLPHAVHTPMLEWPTTGKFWEMNVTKTLKIASIREKSFTRRLIGVKKEATYTTDENAVDAPSKIFQADDDLETKLDSGDAVWCYYRLYLNPWLKKNTPAQARRIISHLSPSLQSQTDELIEILASNQGFVSGEATPGAASVEQLAAFDPQDKDFLLLQKSHAEWHGTCKINERVMNKAQWITAASNASSKKGKQTRSEVLFKVLASPFNFFFDSVPDDSSAVVAAPFASIEPYIALLDEQFGNPAEWVPYMGMSRYTEGGDPNERDGLEFWERPESDDEDNETLEMPEIGHLERLREYEGFNIDRRPSVLRQWILDLSNGRSLGDGWYEVTVPHYQSHGLPGRFLPRPRASLAKLTREARTVSVSGRLQEHDFPISHWKSFARILDENGMLEKYGQIGRYAEHFQAWRDLWGKAALTSLGYGGVPRGEAWNPPVGHSTRRCVTPLPKL